MTEADFWAPGRRDLFRRAGLDTFEALWALERDFIEHPNVDRGGWSGVVRLTLHEPDGTAVRFFLKRQEDFLTRPWRRLFRPELTLERELRALEILRAADIPTVVPLHAAVRRAGGRRQGVLLTEELVGFHSLDGEIGSREAVRSLDPHRRRGLVRAVATAVRRLHGAGYRHGGLYPKHVFVADDGFEVRFLDLEKARPNLGGRAFLRDLDNLNRRAVWVDRALRLRFLLDYTGEPRLSARSRRLWRALARRSGKQDWRRLRGGSARPPSSVVAGS